jgi:hypothetical protein
LTSKIELTTHGFVVMDLKSLHCINVFWPELQCQNTGSPKTKKKLVFFCEEAELFLVLSVAWLLHKNTSYQKSNEGKQAKQISKKA